MGVEQGTVAAPLGWPEAYHCLERESLMREGGMLPGTDLFPGQWQPQVVLMAALEVGLIQALLDRPTDRS